MKRALFILLSLLMFLPLAACGNAESEYKYDTIPELLINETVLSTFTYRPVKGGSLSIMQPQDYLGEDIPSEEWGHEQISVLFDEESKVLTSLCYDYTCLHDSPECFAKAMSMVYGSYWNIVDDTIVVVVDMGCKK